MTRKRLPGEDTKDEERANGRPAKRARKYNEEDVTFARIYEDLSNEISEKRIKASAKLVRKLFEDESPQEHFVNAALGRLVRGLCSGRKAARLGFSVAFTEVLRQIFDRNAQGLDGKAEAVVKLIKSITQADRSLFGQVICKFFRAT